MSKERMIVKPEMGKLYPQIPPDLLFKAMGVIPVNGLTVNRILKSGRATVVFWNDGSKTVVKRGENEPDDAYAAFTAALAIRLYGSNSKLKRLIAAKTVYQKEKKGDVENE